MAQAKAMNSTWLTACGGGAVRVKFQGAKKRLDEGKDINALVANALKSVLKINKRKKSKASSESVSEHEQDHLNFRTLKIGEELPTARMPRSNDAEMTEEGTEVEKELYMISHQINPN